MASLKGETKLMGLQASTAASKGVGCDSCQEPIEDRKWQASLVQATLATLSKPKESSKVL